MIQVLQDMKPLGYESAPRTKGLDVEHCRLALTELAHLHGLSAAMRKLAPDVFESQLIAKYPEVMYREDRRQTMAPFFGHAISGVSKAILTHLPMRYHFAGHILEDISDDAFDEVRRAHQKELLKLYMNEAHWIMQLQGVDDPAGAFYVSLEEMEADMRKHAIFGFLSSCLSMPVIVANQDDVPDMEDFKEEDFGTINPFEKMYSSSAFCRRMRQVIEDFDDMGLFEDIVNGKIYK
ncbi:hypothetical protein B566_EDAN014137 [Ephemera danica]|nr:hypothetical protein B566_EDAN014137 [Ephemera danica]